jgi:hypothetical protein
VPFVPQDMESCIEVSSPSKGNNGCQIMFPDILRVWSVDSEGEKSTCS